MAASPRLGTLYTMEKIELKYKLNQWDYLISNLVGTCKLKVTKILLLIGLLIHSLWIIQLSKQLFVLEFPYAFVIMVGIIIVPGIFIIIIWLASLTYKSSPRLHEEIRVIISSQTISILGKNVDLMKNIDEITYFQKNYTCFGIAFKDRSGLVIPAKVLKNKEHLLRTIIGKSIR